MGLFTSSSKVLGERMSPDIELGYTGITDSIKHWFYFQIIFLVT